MASKRKKTRAAKTKTKRRKSANRKLRPPVNSASLLPVVNLR